MTLQVKVHFFALYRERAGVNDLTLDLGPDATVSQLVAQIRTLFPQLAPPNVDIVVAVNADYADPGRVLLDGDDIALIPPVSGGKI